MSNPTQDTLTRAIQVFSLSVVSLLTLTAAGKIVSIAQVKPFTTVADGVFPFVSTGSVLALGALLEIATALHMACNTKRIVSMVSCFWLASAFLSYRLLAAAFFVGRPCKCLGGVLDWTGLPEKVLDAIPALMLGYMELGSLAFLVHALWMSGARNLTERRMI